jgi:hypothetical protein
MGNREQQKLKVSRDYRTMKKRKEKKKDKRILKWVKFSQDSKDSKFPTENLLDKQHTARLILC